MAKKNKRPNKSKKEIIKKMAQESKEKTEKVLPEAVTPKQVTFVENGRIEWNGFANLYEVIGFMQLHVFQNWVHPIFQNVFLNDVLKPGNKAPSKDDQAAIEAIEELTTDLMEDGGYSVKEEVEEAEEEEVEEEEVEEAEEDEVEEDPKLVKKRLLEAELLALKSQLDEI
jgi:hypothetical protein